jgi:transposase-like protein
MTSLQLQEWRRQSCLGHGHLAALLGVHKQTVYAWERGRQSVPPFLHLALAELGRLWAEGHLRSWFEIPKLDSSMPKALDPVAILACPRCEATNGQVKAGCTKRGSQRYMCRACSRLYTPRPGQAGHSEELRALAVQLYRRKGASKHKVGQELGVSPQSVANWVRAQVSAPNQLGRSFYSSARR